MHHDTLTIDATGMKGLAAQPVHAPALSHPKYRADIDGLRAVAVLSVVGFHAFPSLLKGGFVGVDVFYVISGFLISTIILENLDSNSFSFLEFYNRRIKRIFPALLLVLFAVFAIGYASLFSVELRNLGKHIAAGSSFLSNMLLLLESGYFDSGSERKPLLNLWSLGIEEQFYMVWPLVLWAAHKSKVNTLWPILLIGAASFLLNIHYVDLRPTETFYLPFTRFWELLIGALLAKLSMPADPAATTLAARLNAVVRHSARFPNAVSMAGVALMLTGFLFVDRDDVFPGALALLPTLAATLLILAGPGASFNRTVLSHPVVVWFGKISFPLYLWHWPLLSFTRILEENPSPYVLDSVVLLAIALSWLTYRVIEAPIRKHGGARTTAALIVLSCAVFLLGASAWRTNGYPQRGINAPFKDIDYQLFTLTRAGDSSCKDKLGLPLLSEEVCFANSDRPTVLFVGDSHAMATYSSIYGSSDKLAAAMVSGHSCMPFAHLSYVPTFKDPYGNNCTAIANEALKAIKTIDSLSTVFIINNMGDVEKEKPFVYFDGAQQLSDEEAFLSGNRDLIRQSLAAGKRVVYMISVPPLKYDPVDCVKRFDALAARDCGTPLEAIERKRKTYLNEVFQLKKDFPAMQILDPTGIVCRDGVCGAWDETGEFLYVDFGHISVLGSRKVIDQLQRLLAGADEPGPHLVTPDEPDARTVAVKR